MTDEDPNVAPEPEREHLIPRRDELVRLQQAMQEKLAKHPNDYGVRAWWGFVVVGLLVGWMRSASFSSIVAHGAAFWLAGMLFAIFAVDSPEVQSRVDLPP